MGTRLDPTALRWDDLQLFLAAYRARSLTGAGKVLGLDQSTASRRLASLEQRLQARLFDRVPGGLAPTVLAERVLPTAESAEAAAVAFVREVEAADAAVEGVVRVAVPDGIDSEFVVPRLPALLAQYPGLVIELVASLQVANLARREADLALRLVRPRTGDLVARKVAVLAQGVWVHPRLVAKFGANLGDLPWVDWDDGVGADTGPWLRQFVPEARVVLRANRIDALVAAVVEGLGAAILPDALMRQRSAGLPQPLCKLPAPDADLACGVWLVAHAALVGVPRVRAVWRFLEEQASAYLDGPMPTAAGAV
ncbi:MAG: LysR family transcriptional regulator [Deltaproteobacteria bacterium]|nr:LysR family transcriptional regulator [Deltaproteobacteria bacterium]